MTEEVLSAYPKVRWVTRKDRKKLSQILKKFAERSGNEKLTEMIPRIGGDGCEDSDTDKIYELVKSVMDNLLQWVEDDLTNWFMDLIGVKDHEAYDNLPFDIEMYIIDELIAQKGFHNFFSRASALYKKIRG